MATVGLSVLTWFAVAAAGAAVVALISVVW